MVLFGSRSFWLLSSFILVVLITCSPERDNPYDPKSNRLNISRIIGQIKTKSGYPIVDAKISLSYQMVSQTISTLSDTSGRYKLDYNYKLNYGDSAILSAEKNGYSKIQKGIALDVNKFDTINFVLDAIAQFSAESITSYHEQLYFPGDIFYVNFSTRVMDNDFQGDIESVYVVIPELAKTFFLNYSHSNIYKNSIPAELFPDSTLENLIGKDCFFEVLSVSQTRNRSSPHRLNRIIYDVVEPVSPAFDTMVSANFPIVWHPLSMLFPFTYGVEIYFLRYGIIPELAYQISEIPATDTVVNITKLNPGAGRYFWQVYVRDDLGNISKSAQSVFIYSP